MDYEVLLKSMQELIKKTKDLQDSQKKFLTTIGKDAENGDLKALAKDLGSYADKLNSLTEINASLQKMVSEFDGEAYVTEGGYSDQMLEYCKKENVDVIGQAPNFEMFPFKVKVVPAEQAVYLNNKKVNCLRPKKMVALVRESQDKLSKANFNAEAFGKELMAAYDLLVIKKKKDPEKEPDMPLKEIHSLMAPMSRLKKIYDLNSFAYDLSRFMEEDAKNPIYLGDDHRRMQPGPSREAKYCIRLLDSKGKESYQYSIRFYKED